MGGEASGGAGTSTFDTRALTAPLPTPADGGFVDAAGRRASHMAAVVAVLHTSVLVVGAGALALLLVTVAQAATGGTGLSWTSVVIAAIMVLPLATSRFGAMRGLRRGAEEALYRLERFAATNRLGIRHRENGPDETATVFALGRRRVATAVITGERARRFASGDYSFDTWVARARMPHSLTYLRVDLSVDLPRTSVIAVRAPGAASWRPPLGQERIDAGGGFDERFAVWCAAGDAPDVQRMLTPPVRDGLTAVASDVDIETAGRHVYFLSRMGLPRHTAAYWRWIEDLFAVAQRIEDAAAGRPDPSPAGVLRGTDGERAARRAELFTTPRIAGPAVIGCLLPLVFGVVAGVLTGSWR
ncbi:hypothetical protein [Microbacterium arborescens]|uniref:hypothetical protein n=1 Tax=Microbacterium arborescens TaxID=33883 RepID=UPI003C796C21